MRPVLVAVVAVIAVAAIGVATGLRTASGPAQPGSSGRASVAPYVYRGATAAGELIPIEDRGSAEDVGGSLLTGGGATTLGAYSGEVLVVNFWASWCGPCAVETPQFDVMYRKVKSKGVQVLGVDAMDQRSNARSFVDEHDLSFPSVFDERGDVLRQLGHIPSAGLPVTVLVDKAQRVAAVYLGRLSVTQIEPAIEHLVSET